MPNINKDLEACEHKISHKCTLFEEGRKAGREEGRKKAREEGRKEGRQAGKKKERKKIKIKTKEKCGRFTWQI